MILTKITPRTFKLISDRFSIYAWGGLSVSIEVKDIENPKEVFHIEFSEKDLIEMLKKIEDRKEEIEIELKGPNE